MIAAVKAELRKLLTVRSTYIYVAFSVAIAVLFAGFGEGYKATSASLHGSGLLAGEVTSAVSFVSVIAALVGLLLFAHEYRFNTIMYTLTASNSRTKVLVAKIFAVSAFSLVFTLFMAVLSPLLTLAGVHLHGLHMVAQSIPYANLAWRCLFYGWAYAMLALVIAALIRNLVGAIVVLLLFPAIVENLASLLIKENVKYLPFKALDGVLQTSDRGAVLTPTHAVVVVAAYLIGLWLIAWVLFLRRDAN